MGIFGVHIKKSLHGKSDRDFWKNSYFFTFDGNHDDPEMRAIVDYIVAAERDAHFDTVFFNDAYVKQVAENALNLPGKKHRSIALTGTGNRNTENLVGNDARLLPLEHCLTIRRDCTDGRPGKLSLRGCLIANDVYVTENNNYALKPELFDALSQSGISDYLDAMNAGLPHDAVLVLPDPVDTLFEQFAQSSRVIDTRTIGGISFRARAVVRKPAATKVLNGVQGKINELGNNLRELVEAGVDVSPRGIARIVEITAEVVDLVSSVPLTKISKLKLPPNIKALPGV